MSKTEKRVSQRQDFKRFTCEARVHVTKIEVVDVEFMDISPGGACIITEKVYDKGDFVKLKFPLRTRLAKIKWVAPLNGRFKVGLEFLL